jgi:cell division protein FtsZ
VLLNVTGGPSLTLHEVAQAASIIYDQSDEDAHIIIGSVIDENMGEEVSVTVIATGFHQMEQHAAAMPKKDVTCRLDDIEPKATAHVKYEKVVARPEELYQRDARHEGVAQEQPLLDINALDIPTFLRQQYKTKEDN